MELSTLRELWQEKNPSGNIWIIDSKGHLFESGKQTGKFGVSYNSTGKIYTYSEKSIYKLAERFNLIPESNIDFWVESQKALTSLLNNQEFESCAGLRDTIKMLYEKQTGRYISVELTESHDKYDRPICTYTLKGIFANYEEYIKQKYS